MSNALALLAAGGTGGHLFPAVALAEELRQRGWRTMLVTDARGARFVASTDELPVLTLPAAGSTRGWWPKMRAGITLLAGLVRAEGLIRRLQPAVVVGFGGYPAVPACIAAARTRVPVILHEQNAVLGRANRLLLRFSRRLATSYAQLRGVPPRLQRKVTLTGNPVRAGILAHLDRPYGAPAPDMMVRLLILGGSQGAQILSRVVPEAIGILPDSLRRRLIITQQCREADLPAVRNAWAALGIEAALASFFPDIAQQMADCHLLITRAGASTIAELTALGRPAILVPYGAALQDEQTANAEAVAAAGGGWLMPESAFTPEALAVRLGVLLTLEGSLAQAAAAARRMGQPDAARLLADLVTDHARVA